MSMSNTLTAHSPARKSRTAPRNPLAAGLPDPRPLTDYTVVYDEIAGNSRITIKLQQPCIIRTPDWSFIDCADGSSITAKYVTPSGNDSIVFDFSGIIPESVAFVDVPYQDVQVQNFQGGFVRPGGKWFRMPQ